MSHTATHHTSQLNIAYDCDECYHNATTRLPPPKHTHHTTTTTTTTTTSPTPTPGQTKRDGKAVKDENGPKRHLTCRLGTRWVLFFHYSCLFFLLNYIYRYYVCYRDTGHLLGGHDEGNGPKRRKTRRLGTRCVFFFYYSVFFLY